MSKPTIPKPQNSRKLPSFLQHAQPSQVSSHRSSPLLAAMTTRALCSIFTVPIMCVCVCALVSFFHFPSPSPSVRFLILRLTWMTFPTPGCAHTRTRSAPLRSCCFDLCPLCPMANCFGAVSLSCVCSLARSLSLLFQFRRPCLLAAGHSLFQLPRRRDLLLRFFHVGKNLLFFLGLYTYEMVS